MGSQMKHPLVGTGSVRIVKPKCLAKDLNQTNTIKRQRLSLYGSQLFTFAERTGFPASSADIVVRMPDDPTNTPPRLNIEAWDGLCFHAGCAEQRRKH